MMQPEATGEPVSMEHQVNSPEEFLLLEFQLIYLGASVLPSGWGKGEQARITVSFCPKEAAGPGSSGS